MLATKHDKFPLPELEAAPKMKAINRTGLFGLVSVLSDLTSLKRYAQDRRTARCAYTEIIAEHYGIEVVPTLLILLGVLKRRLDGARDGFRERILFFAGKLRFRQQLLNNNRISYHEEGIKISHHLPPNPTQPSPDEAKTKEIWLPAGAWGVDTYLPVFMA